jgi:two-component system, NarL family, sensor histidine kinase UhpB
VRGSLSPSAVAWIIDAGPERRYRAQTLFLDPMKSRSLLVQVLAVNLLLVAGTVLLLTLAVHERSASAGRGRDALVFGLAATATLLGNWLLLRRRFMPLDELISVMERIDLAVARQPLSLPGRKDSAEVRRLEAAFTRMVARLEAERRVAAGAAVQAQERERRRIAQDLHDEVNQALTAVSLRLQASIEHAPEPLRTELMETKRLATQAMEELLTIARHLRPAVLDDLGLLAALGTQMRDFREQTGSEAALDVRGDPGCLPEDQQLVIYRVTQESLSNVAQHARAHRVTVELSCADPVILRIRDDGQGFRPEGDRGVGLGLSGMRERALLVSGRLAVSSRPGTGTEVELVLPGARGGPA